jgi:hypothetical protein
LETLAGSDIQDDDTPSAGGRSDGEEEKKPKISTPRQKAAVRQKMPDGTEAKTKITTGGKGAKKPKADASVRSFR